MIARLNGLSRFRWVGVVAVLSAAAWLVPGLSKAGDLKKLDTSLKLIPADASFYVSMLRNREQFDALKNSKAWAKLKETQMVKDALAEYESQKEDAESGPGKIQAMLDNPESMKIFDMLTDMASEEMFVYGDHSFVDFVDLYQSINSVNMTGAFQVLLAKQQKNQTMQGGVILEQLAADPSLLVVPNVVFGFKLKNKDLAKEQLVKLEMILNIFLSTNETFQNRFKRTKVGDYEYLVLTLDGAMIPWDDLQESLESVELNDGDAKKVIEHVKKMKLVLTLGIRDDYLLASIGSSVDCLKRLGKGELLANRKEFKMLAKHADERLTSISYSSEALNQQLSTSAKQLDAMARAFDASLSDDDCKLTDDQKTRVRKDAKDLVKDLKTIIRERGAALGFSFLSERGIESYAYQWGDHRDINATKPLGLLEHVGGSPMFGIVGRGRTGMEEYDLLVKWVKVGYGYFVDFGLPALSEKERKEAETFFKTAIPLAVRLDKNNRENLFPALAEGQVGFVVDNQLMSKQMHKEMPASKQPLPWPEPALLVGVSKPDLLEKGFVEYRLIGNELLEAIRKIDGCDMPDWVKIPEPTVTETSEGKIFTFKTPADWGLDKQFELNFGLSKNAGVFSTNLAHTKRLLAETPLKIGGLLTKPEEIRGAAAWLLLPKLLKSGSPWADYFIEQNTAKEEQKKVGTQTHSILEILECIRLITAECRVENGVLESHSLLEIRDVK
jgi:hypothetical protein